jgi:hypothetical protein
MTFALYEKLPRSVRPSPKFPETYAEAVHASDT